MMDDNIRKAILAGRYEEADGGLYLPTERSLVQGVVCYGKRGEEEEWTHNLIVDEGRNYLVGVATGAVSAISNWYVAIFTGDVSVQPSWTAANFAANATEITQYDEATRPAWVPGAVASGARDSFASKASFTSSANGVVARGAALISASGKSATSGTLMGSTRFSTDKGLDIGEILDVGYALQITAL